jgi:hypothetical protein
MSDIARQLRAQIPFSTDPKRLERMAREAERLAITNAPNPTEGGSAEALPDAESFVISKQ